MPIASPDALINEVGANHGDGDDSEASAKRSSVSQITASADNSEAEIPRNKDPSVRQKQEKLRNRSSSHSRTISGGLTLNRTNKSLKNLILYIKTAYSNNLTSPKWKNFKGLKLQVVEKIRLNNVIWRTWFDQCKKNLNFNILKC